SRTPAPEPALPWLAALLTHQPVPTLEALRLLCRSGYLPAPQHTVLLTALTRVGTQLESPTSDTGASASPRHTSAAMAWRTGAVVDQIAMLLGGTVLIERVETALAALDQLLTAPSVAPAAARHRQQRQRRSPTPADSITAETAHVLQL